MSARNRNHDRLAHRMRTPARQAPPLAPEARERPEPTIICSRCRAPRRPGQAVQKRGSMVCAPRCPAEGVLGVSASVRG